MSSTSLAQQRLAEERKNFRKQRPFGFEAKPLSRPDGSVDLYSWSCKVPGKPGSLCEGARYPVTLNFGEHFPSKPPKVYMPKGFFHVNVCERTGAVCLSMLKEDVPSHLLLENASLAPGWSPSFSVSQVLQAVQELLATPNFGSILGAEAYEYKKKHGIQGYNLKTQEQALKYAEADDEL